MTRTQHPARTGCRRSAKLDGDARELILDAAEQLFAAKGFDATPSAADERGPGGGDLIEVLIKKNQGQHQNSD